MNALPYGEDALYVDLEHPEPESRGALTRHVAAWLRREISAPIQCGSGVIVVHDRDQARVLRIVKRALAAPVHAEDEHTLHTIPVRYDGVDLLEVARGIGISGDALIALHTSPMYEVELL